LYWRFSDDQTYLDGACNLMNYILGLNPLGICYVTGLGMHRIHNPHDRESGYTKAQGWGPKPGITVFGPGVISDIGVVGDGLKTYPDIGALPFERKFGDDITSISTAEFTIFETMSHNALYTVLSNGGTWDERQDPYVEPTSINKQPQISSEPVPGTATAEFYPGTHSLRIAVILPAQGRISGELFLLNGKRIARFTSGMLEKGKNSITIPLNSGELRGRLHNGIVFCRIRGSGAPDRVQKVVCGF